MWCQTVRPHLSPTCRLTARTDSAGIPVRARDAFLKERLDADKGTIAGLPGR